MKGTAAVSAILVATLVAAVVGCGGGSQRPTTTHAAPAPPKCTLSAKQRRVIVQAKRMIARMHRLEAPLKTVHKVGPPALEHELNRFLLAIGVLPPDERALLIRQAKGATAACMRRATTPFNAHRAGSAA